MIDSIKTIYEIISKDSKHRVFDFIDLGVGYGQKDYTILSWLLENADESTVHYYPIDLSFPMLQHNYNYIT